MKLTGNSTGIKHVHYEQITALYAERYPTTLGCTMEQALQLLALSNIIRRQITLCIDRRGVPIDIIIGTRTNTVLQSLPKSGKTVRLLRTHCTEELCTQEELLQLLHLQLGAITILTSTKEGVPSSIQYAYTTNSKQTQPYIVSEPILLQEIDSISFPEIEFLFPKNIPIEIPTITNAKTAILISISSASKEIQAQHLEELQSIAETAGITTMGVITQRTRGKRSSSLSVEKMAEIELLAMQHNATFLIFDEELSPAQLKTISEHTQRNIIDRTQLILDIFATNAHSKEGKLQVEIAQLRYLQPRLVGQSSALDRLAGGIGGRGPGESKLEMDRRKILTRIHTLQKEVSNIAKHRFLQREKRLQSSLPIISIVGYTNAGKSSLLNFLTKSSILAENKLFATLESTTRKLYLSPQKEVLLTDTVGFIRNLPEELMNAFTATLEELHLASFLLHVVDASHDHVASQIHSVETVLASLQLEHTPSMLVLNKWDVATEEQRATLLALYPNAVPFSTKTQIGKRELLTRIEKEVCLNSVRITP